jgi:uncharacterized integral membrane protein
MIIAIIPWGSVLFFAPITIRLGALIIQLTGLIILILSSIAHIKQLRAEIRKLQDF